MNAMTPMTPVPAAAMSEAVFALTLALLLLAPLAFAAAQAGLLLALEPAVSRLLTRPRLGRRVKNPNATVMTLYLWPWHR